MDNPSTPKRDYALHAAAAILRLDEAEVSGMVRRGQLTGYMDEHGRLHILLPLPDGVRSRPSGSGDGPSSATPAATAGHSTGYTNGARQPDTSLADDKVWACLRETFQLQRDLIGQLIATLPGAGPNGPSNTESDIRPADTGALEGRLNRLERIVDSQQDDLKLLAESVRIVRDYLDAK